MKTYYLDPIKLKKIMNKILKAHGLSHNSTYHLINSLLQTSLRGVDSHGINLFPHYLEEIKLGRLNKKPNIKIRKYKAISIIDGDNGIGQYIGYKAMKLAIKLAKNYGISGVSVYNSNHFGAAAYFGLIAPKYNCIGIVISNANARVKVTNSKDAYFGTNPLCICVPLKDEEPICLDMATSVTTVNKIKSYELLNKLIPSDWGFDDNGNPTIYPNKIKTLAPIGEYKGYGLGLIIEVLCGLLTGGPFGIHIPKMHSQLDKKRQLSHFFCAIDIEKFIDINTFKNNVQKMVNEIRLLPSLNNSKVMVPGDPEKYHFIKRSITGIPITKKEFKIFLEISEEFEDAIV